MPLILSLLVFLGDYIMDDPDEVKDETDEVGVLDDDAPIAQFLLDVPHDEALVVEV